RPGGGCAPPGPGAVIHSRGFQSPPRRGPLHRRETNYFAAASGAGALGVSVLPALSFDLAACFGFEAFFGSLAALVSSPPAGAAPSVAAATTGFTWWRLVFVAAIAEAPETVRKPSASIVIVVRIMCVPPV